MKTLWKYLLVAFVLTALLAACGKPEISDVEHVQQAKQYQTDGDFKASLIELKNALQKNPKNPEARLLLGELYVLLGNGAAAEKELQRARELGVAGPFVERLGLRAKLLQKQFDEVLETLTEKESAGRPELQTLRGEALLGLGRNEEAKAAFRSALRENPDETDALLGLARTALILEDVAAATEALQTLSEVDPENAEAWLLKGDLARLNENDTEALSAYQKSIELLPATVTTRTGITARTRLTRLLLAQGKFSEAETHIDYLLKAAPKHPTSSYLAALLAYEQGDYTASRDYLLNVMKAAPDHLPGLFLLGSVNFSLGNLEQAEVQLARVVAERPLLMPARMMLAEIRLRQAEAGDVLGVLEPALAQHPHDARLLALAGQAALREGDLESGRQYLKQAVAEQPDDSGLRAQLAMLYLAEGNDAQAIKELEEAVKSGKSPGREQSMLALAYLKQEAFDEALGVAQDLAAANPESAYAQNLLGTIFSAQGNIRQARDAFVKALRIDPEFSAAALNLARLDVLEGRLEGARARLDTVLLHDENNVSAMLALAQLEDAANNREQALAWLERARTADATALPPRLLLIRYYSRTGELERARKIAREAAAIDAQDPRVLMARGRIELESGEYRAAAEIFERAVKMLPTAQAYYALGVARFRANEIEAAELALKEALKRQPGHIQAASLRVLVEVSAGRFEDALHTVDEIKKYNPGSPAGHVLEGDIYTRQQKYAKAASAYAQARKLGGGTSVVLKEATARRHSEGDGAAVSLLRSWVNAHENDIAAHYALAVAHHSGGRKGDAVKEYRRLLKKAPSYVPALNDLAWLLAQDGKLEEAERLAVKAYESQPDSGPVLDTLGWIRLRKGDAKAALGLLRQAAEKMPEAGDVQYHLAAALAQSGKQAESKEILEKILGDGWEFSSVDQARQLLEILSSGRL